MRAKILAHEFREGMIVKHVAGLLCRVIGGPEWRFIRGKPDEKHYKVKVEVLALLEPFRPAERPRWEGRTVVYDRGPIPNWCLRCRDAFPPGTAFWAKRCLLKLPASGELIADLETGERDSGDLQKELDSRREAAIESET